jgi:HD-like signal output (HDOD) protein
MTLPQVSTQILEASKDPDVSLKNYADIIAHDQVIAAKVVRIANSSFFRGLNEITSLAEAIKRLGFRNVANAAMAIGLKKVFRTEQRSYRALMESLWTHATQSAVTCREIARAARLPGADQYFLLGLVHDIGRVYIVLILDKLAATDERFTALPEQLLDEVQGQLQNRVGAGLLEEWAFPSVLVEAVRNQGASQEGEGRDVGVDLIQTNELVIRKLGFGGLPPDDSQVLSAKPCVQALRLDDLHIAKLLVDLEDKAEEMKMALAD